MNIFLTTFKITLLLLLVSVGITDVSAQEQRLNFLSKKLTRQQVIQQIEAQSSLKVNFSRVSFDDSRQVQLSHTNLMLREALDKLVENSGHVYFVDDKHVVIYKHAPSNQQLAVVVKNHNNITGTVCGKDGQPLEGVSIELTGERRVVATTFANGRFRLDSVSSGSHIIRLTSADGQLIRYREVEVPADRDIDVALFMGGDMVQPAAPAGSDSRQDTRNRVKTNTYFVPKNTDHTIRAFSDEPLTEYGFIPYKDMNAGDYLPKVGVKTNLLVWATTTPNVAIEFALAKKWTFDLAVAYNPFQLQKGGVNHVTIVSPEVRYWFCQRFERHFVGLHALAGTFNIGDVTFLTRTFETNRYDGWGVGGGLTYGYHLPMGKRWAWEFMVGAGYVYLKWDKYRCYDCDEYVGKKGKHYFGPTKAGVSLVFMIK